MHSRVGLLLGGGACTVMLVGFLRADICVSYIGRTFFVEEKMSIWSFVVLVATFAVLGLAARLRKEASMEDVEQVNSYQGGSLSNKGGFFCKMWCNKMHDLRWRPRQKAWVQFTRKQQGKCHPTSRWVAEIMRVCFSLELPYCTSSGDADANARYGNACAPMCT